MGFGIRKSSTKNFSQNLARQYDSDGKAHITKTIEGDVETHTALEPTKIALCNCNCKLLGRLNYSFGVRRSSILKSVCAIEARPSIYSHSWMWKLTYSTLQDDVYFLSSDSNNLHGAEGRASIHTTNAERIIESPY